MFELQVQGMSCGGCASRVTKAVHSVDSGAKVDVDIKNKMVHVESPADINAVTSAITAAGYPALIKSTA
jgi:copper chaperone